MQNTINFALQPKVTETYKPFSTTKLAKWKFLERPLNWILTKLKAYELCKETSYIRIAIDLREASKLILGSAIAYEHATGKRPTHIIIGYDVMQRLQMEECTKYFYATSLKVNQFGGFTLVLHPFINDIVPVAL